MKNKINIIKEELDNVGLDYGWCGCCGKGIDSRDRICESCWEFSKHIILRTIRKMDNQSKSNTHLRGKNVRD